MSTLTQMRSEFWIIKGSQTVKRIVTKCVICKVIQGTMIRPLSPNLPNYRISTEFAFEVTWLDFAGPSYVKNIYSLHESMMFKSYILLFTGSSTRNVHLELTPTMDVNSVFRAIKRFLARRGIVKMFISDNVSSFIADKLISYLRGLDVAWSHILPNSPW